MKNRLLTTCWIIATIAIAILGSFAGFKEGQMIGNHLRHTSPAEVCEEDMPCWDCTTMGNHICGDLELGA